MLYKALKYAIRLVNARKKVPVKNCKNSKETFVIAKLQYSDANQYYFF